MAKLHTDHEGMLIHESGIAPGVVEARGYRTVETKAELKRLGFSDAQCGVPGMLIPIYNPAGELVLYQFRPNQPRIRDGKAIKYETLKGCLMALDVHPFAREKLGDPSVPIFLTEGVKKGDCLISRDLCAITLLGVWNWRGTNQKGGKVVLPEWEYVALNSRRAYVVFDSDIMFKTSVYRAMLRLKGFLEGRGAEVAVIYLPAARGGGKEGVDDFLASGHSVDDLLSLATTELKKPPAGDEFDGEPDTQADALVRYARDAKLFRTPDGVAYVTFPVGQV